MMGAGKSSVGRFLERETGLRRVDTDEIVSQRFGKSVGIIFSELGEELFRAAETEALADLTPSPPAVIVTGGGIVLRDKNVQHLKRLGTVVWLHAEEDVLFERASRRGTRPLLKTTDPRSTFANILAEREPLYRAAADLQVDTSKRNHEQVAQVILSQLATESLNTG